MKDDQSEKAREESIARWKSQQEQDESVKGKQIGQTRTGIGQKTWLAVVILGSLILISGIVCFAWAVAGPIESADPLPIQNTLGTLGLVLSVIGIVILAIGISLRGKRKK